MTCTFAADSKMMFYPTDVREVYRLGNVVGEVRINLPKLKQLNFDAYAKATVCASENQKNKYTDLTDYFYHYLIENNHLDLIDQCCSIKINYAINNTVLDPFAGEGKWLEFFGSHFDKQQNLSTVAIEPDRNRFAQINATTKFNALFEETELPKNCVNLLLYNPPYGETNGVRNVRHYLKMILDRGILNDRCKIIAVIRGDDAIECYDLLYDNFEINLVYRVNKEEYDKYKQFVIVATKRNHKPSVFSYTSDKNKFEVVINDAADPDVNIIYDKYLYMSACGEWGYSWGRFEQSKARKNICSKRDKVWDWIIKDYEAKIDDDFRLLMPKPPKTSELANILASGIINGEINDSESPHIVSGGVKKISRQELVVDDDGNSKYVDTQFSKPFLNILYKQDGKIKVKQIEGSSE